MIIEYPPGAELVKVVLTYGGDAEYCWRHVRPGDREDPKQAVGVVYEIPADQYARWAAVVQAHDVMMDEVAAMIDARYVQINAVRRPEPPRLRLSAEERARSARNAATWRRPKEGPQRES